MSLNKTLDRLFDEIRREAKRNPEFADRLDAVLRLHESRRDVADEVFEEAAARAADVPAGKARSTARKPAGETPAVQASAPLNPVGLLKREGEAGLAAALAARDLAALQALVVEHNLDPSGVTPSLSREDLAAHILAQAKRRVERDEKMFEY
jgi:hypothetical protein